MKKYSAVIWGITLLLLSGGCDLIIDSYHPKQILGYPSPSESSIQLRYNKVKVTAKIISVDVECTPVKKENAGRWIFGGETEYEIAAIAHIGYKIIDKGFKATAFSNLEADLIFEPVTASGCRRALVTKKVRFIENADLTTTSVKIRGLSVEEINRIFGVQARWE